jgi:hypothetical protein
MYGFYGLDPETAAIEHDVAVNVSDVFVSRYFRTIDDDPLVVRSRESRLPVYNRDLMSEAEWTESKGLPIRLQHAPDAARR